ncbi:hypothetical protein Bhyg_09473 [Pseudolycoriella hygida]|uniref:Uncharacterized protein n=1 Tax=Pseudolycoriella hygida TaxID=35572 RepID=A0A9Q0S4F5_9DIPT|nr:hypothetical protein Bhyg_09473 [Pseudolycoriella hygida]
MHSTIVTDFEQTSEMRILYVLFIALVVVVGYVTAYRDENRNSGITTNDADSEQTSKLTVNGTQEDAQGINESETENQPSPGLTIDGAQESGGS